MSTTTTSAVTESLPSDEATSRRSPSQSRAGRVDESAFEHPACDLCGCSTHAVLFEKKDTTSYWRAKCAEDPRLDVDMPFPVVRCDGCGHVFVCPRLKPEINADIYARFWRSRQPQELRYDTFATYMSRQLAALGKLGRLLDFGCGWGSILAAAKAVGWDAVGIEVDTAKVAFAENHGLKAVHGDLLDRVFESASFDAVVAQQVFEHLYQPAAYLEEIRRILKPGGVLFVGVPNYGGVQAKLQGPKWDMISPIAHVRYFTGRSLGRFLADHGFEVARKRHLPRYEGSFLKNAVYHGLVLVENNLNLYPHKLSVFARKL